MRKRTNLKAQKLVQNKKLKNKQQQQQQKLAKRVFWIPEAGESGLLLHLVSIPACFPSAASPLNLLSLASHTEGASC